MMGQKAIVGAGIVTVVLAAGCGHAVRDSLKTAGEAAERAVEESERTRGALVMAEDASNAARDAADAARHPHPGLLGRARERLVRNWANEAEDRAEDARDRAEDARDRIDDARDRAQEAEDAARRAREWMSDKGFYTTEEYWDCDRYRGSEALEDQPLACIYANETRALAKVVRWRSDRIEARADMAEALASRAQAFADLAWAERLEEEMRAAVREVAERELERANGRVAEVNELFAQQNEEWQRIQELAGGWIEGAEQSYAMLKDDGGGGWRGVLVGGLVGAAAGATGAAALGITGSDAVELTTLAAVAGAESGGDGDGSLTAAVAEGISPGQALSATSMPAVPGGVTDPSLDQAFSDLQQMLTNALASRSSTTGVGGPSTGILGVAQSVLPPPLAAPRGTASASEPAAQETDAQLEREMALLREREEEVGRLEAEVAELERQFSVLDKLEGP